MPNTVTVSEPEVNTLQDGTGGALVALVGAWDIRSLERQSRALQQTLRGSASARDARWDLSKVQRLDHIGALLIWRAWGKKRPAQIELRPEHEIFFANLEGTGALVSGARRTDWFAPVRALGEWMLGAGEHTADIVRLLGQMLIDSMVLLRRPALGPWREISASVHRIGTQALGITAAVGFLIGIVMSYLSAEQLRAFGADVFIVNILGLGIIRELGPVICAVLVAGRSGSAISAQLGVMRVTEELDALAVMGIPYTVRLILPKVVGLAIAMPLLTLWTSGIALLGGAIGANLQLGMSVTQFLTALPAAVPTVNLWLGVGKGMVFGVLIALIACHFGMRIKPNTESLGAGTTNSVVTSITTVIVADAVFAVMFKNIGISLL